MPSATDLDQGGTFREWVNSYLGPSVGWVRAPRQNVYAITAGGTYVIPLGVSLITVNTTGAVIIKLPSAIFPSQTAGSLPGKFLNTPITIVDIGGNATLHPITIQPASVAENIMGLASIQISVNYGGYVLQPQSSISGWTSLT